MALQNKKILDEIVEKLKTIYDPEIPVNIYDLGLIYDITESSGKIDIIMTLTSPNCPVAEILPQWVINAVKECSSVTDVNLDLTWDPSWNPSMISEEGQWLLEIETGMSFPMGDFGMAPWEMMDHEIIDLSDD